MKPTKKASISCDSSWWTVPFSCFSSGTCYIALTFVPVVGLSASALADVQITDVIAVSVLIGVGVVRTTSRLFRLSLGLACLAVSWILVFAWHPAGRFGEGVKELVVGATQLHVLSSSFPILPWVGVSSDGRVVWSKAFGPVSARRPQGIGARPFARVLVRFCDGIDGARGSRRVRADRPRCLAMALRPNILAMDKTTAESRLLRILRRSWFWD